MSDDNRPKLCLYCIHMYWTEAEPDWSDLTPGSDMDMGCQKNYWSFDACETTQDQHADNIRTAETCPDFEERKD